MIMIITLIINNNNNNNNRELGSHLGGYLRSFFFFGMRLPHHPEWINIIFNQKPPRLKIWPRIDPASISRPILR